MQIENVLELFAKLSGLSEEELYQARFLCEMAMEHIRSRCTGNEEEEGGRQSFAAAAGGTETENSCYNRSCNTDHSVLRLFFPVRSGNDRVSGDLSRGKVSLL